MYVVKDNNSLHGLLNGLVRKLSGRHPFKQLRYQVLSIFYQARVLPLNCEYFLAYSTYVH